MNRKASFLAFAVLSVAIFLTSAYTIYAGIETAQIFILISAAAFVSLHFLLRGRNIQSAKLVYVLIISLSIAMVVTFLVSYLPTVLESFRPEVKADIIENKELVSLLQNSTHDPSLSGRLLLAMHGYDHENPLSGSEENEFIGLSLENVRDRMSKGYKILQSANLTPTGFIAPGGKYTQELIDVVSQYNLPIVNVSYREYTWMWRNMTTYSEETFAEAWQNITLKKPAYVLIHVQDYNQYTSDFLDMYFNISPNSTLEVDDINVQTSPISLSGILNLTKKYGSTSLVLGVTPRFYRTVSYSGLFDSIQIVSWNFFLFLVVFLNVFFICLSTVYKIQSNHKYKYYSNYGSHLPKVSIVIPMFNEEASVEKTMHHAAEQTYPGPIEIVAVDDGSTDSTYDIVCRIAGKAKSKLRAIKIIRQKNTGKPMALNKGICASTGGIIISTDGDSFLDRNAVDMIANRFLEDPGVGAVSGLIKIMNEKESWLTRLSHIEYIKEQALFRGCQSMTGDVVICPGAFFAARREVLLKNPSTDRTVVEDCEQTCLIRKSGWKIVFEPTAISKTRAPSNLRSWWNQRLRWFYGYLQVWSILRDFGKKKPWMIYSYLGYPMTFLVLLIMMLPLALILLAPMNSYLITSMLIYSGIGLLLSIGVQLYSLFVLAPSTISKSTIPWILLFPLYEFMIIAMKVYLYAMYLLGEGPVMKYGPSYIHAMPNGIVKSAYNDKFERQPIFYLLSSRFSLSRMEHAFSRIKSILL